MSIDKTDSVISTIAHIHLLANKIIVKGLRDNGLENLVTSHGDILVYLYEHKKGAALNAVTSAINKDKSTVTALVNKLEKFGYVKKSRNISDGRSTMIKLTKKGLDTKPVVVGKISSKLMQTAYKNFSHEEKKRLTELLEKMKANFGE